jgi:hypothetical protein
MNSSRDTSLPYYGFLPAGALVVVAIVLVGTSRVVLNLVILLIGGAVVAEGVALLGNWRGGADEFARRLQADSGSVLSFFSPPLVRAILGTAMIALGGIAIWGGVRYL